MSLARVHFRTSNHVEVREGSLAEAHSIHLQIPEFGNDYLLDQASRLAGEHLILIAEIAETPVGYLVGYPAADGTFYCWMTGVAPRWRGRNALTAMMSRFVAHAKERGYAAVTIKTRNNRRAMLGFLVKHGFDIVAVEPKEDIRENRIRLVGNI